MVTSYPHQASLASLIPILEPTERGSSRGDDRSSSARADCTEGRWYVRVALTDAPDTAMQSARVIIQDLDTQRIILHTLWTDWSDVPLLTTFFGTAPAQIAPGGMATDLASALVAALRYDATACLHELGVPSGPLPPQPLGSRERAAQRNLRDVAMREHAAIPTSVGRQSGRMRG